MAACTIKRLKIQATRATGACFQKTKRRKWLQFSSAMGVTRKAHLSRVQTTFSPGFPTRIAHSGQMCLWLLSRPLFNRDKCNFSKQKTFSSPAPEEPASTNPKIGPKLQYRNPDLIHNTLHITYQDLIHTSKKAQDLIHNT